MANIIGLVLGFTIGGEGVFLWYSRTQQAPAPSAVVAQAERPPPPVVSAPPVAATPEPRPIALPRIASPLPSQPQTLPAVIHPEEPEEPHRPGSAVAGTGFFVASDGSLITAAHVVNGCRATRIASQFVRPTKVRLIATDTKRDVALLRADNVTPPATLPLGRPASAGGRLFVLGYPANGGPLIPTETWGTLENGHLQPAPADFVDPRRLIWAAAPAVAHGFSGGPMLDPRNGTVVGIVRGMVDSGKLHGERPAIPAHGMVIGPGSAPLLELLGQEGADDDAIATSGDDALDTARRATVHVLCLY